MANCDQGNNTLDPFQILLDASDKTVGTLEKQASSILPFVTDFRNQGDTFDPNDVSQSSVVDAALAEFTKEAICASKTDLEPINQFIEDCLNDALRAVRQYINDMLGNVEDGIDLIQDILNLPESALMKLLQKIWKLCRDIRNLIGGIDGKLQCITVADQEGKYTAEVEALESRIDTVTTDLYLDDDGSFNHEKLIAGFDNGLQGNLDRYKARSDDLQLEIEEDIETTVNIPTTVNPKRKY